jgi:hypothetical protein
MSLITPLPMTLGKCLWLCLPALLVGFALRLVFLTSIPEGFYGADSNSYFDTADHLWNSGEWEMGAKRLGLYPLFMVATTVLPGSPAVVGAVLPHAMGLAALVGRCGKRDGGGGGIRTHGPLRVSGFQDRRDRPLCHPSLCLQEYLYAIRGQLRNPRVGGGVILFPARSPRG